MVPSNPSHSRILWFYFSRKFCAHSFAMAAGKGWPSCFLAVNGLASQSGFSNGHVVFSWRSPLERGSVVGMVETFQKKRAFLVHLTLAQHLSTVCWEELQFWILLTKSEVPDWIPLPNMVKMRCSKAEIVWFCWFGFREQNMFCCYSSVQFIQVIIANV